MPSYVLPTGYVTGTTGSAYTTVPTERIGGAAMGITNATNTQATNPITRTLSINAGIKIGAPVSFRTIAIAASGGSHSYSAQKATSGGTFSYEAKRNEFQVFGVSTKINGSTNNALLGGGTEGYLIRRDIRQKSFGAKTVTAWRSNYLRFTRVLGAVNARSPWTTNPSSLNDTYRLPTNNAVASDDQALYVTYRSIPGEYVIMRGSLAPYMGDYIAKNG